MQRILVDDKSLSDDEMIVSTVSVIKKTVRNNYVFRNDTNNIEYQL